MLGSCWLSARRFAELNSVLGSGLSRSCERVKVLSIGLKVSDV